MKDVGIFYDPVVNFWLSGLFYGHLVHIYYGHLVYFKVIWYIFPVLVRCIKKILATLQPV
jgi:hypothetical protein